MEGLFVCHSVCMLSGAQDPLERDTPSHLTSQRNTSNPRGPPLPLSPCVSSLFKVMQFGPFSSHALILKDRPL